MPSPKAQITLYKTKKDIRIAENDIVVIEEPLQIDLLQEGFPEKNGSREEEPSQAYHQTYSITMRTPGDDQYLAYGLLFSEGVIHQAENIESITPSADKGVVESNVLNIKFVSSFELKLEDQSRRLASYSGCGMCGKTSLKALTLKKPRKQRKLQLNLSCSDILKVRQILSKQTLFSGTGGSHVSGVVYESLRNGQPRLDFDSAKCYEDVGRHNALDKLIGFELVNNNLSKSGIVILSGRIGFELVQKVVMSGFSTIIALGAPSSLAVKTANQFGVTLIGFAKDEQYNLYTF